MSKINKQDLINIISDESHYPKKEVKEILDNYFDLIADLLDNGNEINISNFGSFILKTRKQKEIYHPSKKAKVLVDERKTIVFKPSQNLKKNINDKK